MFENHGTNTFTHHPHDPQLWLEVRATDESDMDWVYGMHMIFAREIRSGHTTLTIGTQQSNLSKSTLEFELIVLEYVEGSQIRRGDESQIRRRSK
jgi:hypothetical protein